MAYKHLIFILWIVFGIIGILVGLLLVAKMVLIHYANIDNRNFGNLLDRMIGIYLLSGGNVERMRCYKRRLYYNPKNYPEAVFLPTRKETSQFPKFKLSYSDYALVKLNTEYGISSLWTSPLQSKRYIIPYARQCIQKFIGEKAVHEELADTICIHFRCSDIPFNRHPIYHIYNFQWYQKALDIAMHRNTNFKKIMLISCNMHRDPKGLLFVNDETMKKNQAQCRYFLEQYVTQFQSFTSLPVEIRCSTIEQDLYNMHHAGCLICTTGSFAYYAGFASSDSNLMIVSETLGCGWKRPGMIVVPGGKINHAQVHDYYDKKEMQDHLQTKTT